MAIEATGGKPALLADLNRAPTGSHISCAFPALFPAQTKPRHGRMARLVPRRGVKIWESFYDFYAKKKPARLAYDASQSPNAQQLCECEELRSACDGSTGSTLLS